MCSFARSGRPHTIINLAQAREASMRGFLKHGLLGY
jgi:hypothetical protein